MYEFAIVVVGYSRVDSIHRLLKSLENASYSDYNVTLIISIDNSGCHDVESLANEFEWTHGKKKVFTYPRRMGLRKHILKCGSYVKNYDAIIVLEDDLVVSPGFFHYVEKVYAKYKDDDQIAGISLYGYRWNENIYVPFEPALSSFDVFFMQMSQSWGQVWSKRQWWHFINWYSKHFNDNVSADDMPRGFSIWPDSSWKKYHIKYMIQENKYMVYPYKSLSTCYSEVGVHSKKRNTCLQVPLLIEDKQDYSLPNFNDEKAVKYDVFFERVFCERIIQDIPPEKICVDLYGSKVSYRGKEYLLSTLKKPYRIIQSYGLVLKPQEENIVNNVQGDDIFLYDLNTMQYHLPSFNEIRAYRYRYNLYGLVNIFPGCIRDILNYHLLMK